MLLGDSITQGGYEMNGFAAQLARKCRSHGLYCTPGVDNLGWSTIDQMSRIYRRIQSKDGRYKPRVQWIQH